MVPDVPLPSTPAGALPVRIRVLGTLHISRGKGDGAVLTQPRRLALLIYLVLAEPRGYHSRDTLVALLWPESGAVQGRQALRNALHALRKSLGEQVIAAAGHDLVGVDRAYVRCDVHDLEAALGAGRMEEALRQYRELASGFHVSDAPGFERWLDATRARVRDRLARAVLSEAGRLEALGQGREGLRLVQALRAQDPDDETLLRRHLELAAAVGDGDGALRAYRAFAERLAAEYDAKPSRETETLMAALWTRGRGSEGGREGLSVAVLPIVVSDAVEDAAPLAQALSDGVIRRLTQLRGVRVLARGVVAPYGQRAVPALEAGRALDADLVVDAALATPAGTGDLEVRLEVIRTADGVLLREATLRADRLNLFALEGAVTSAIQPFVGSTVDDDAGDGGPKVAGAVRGHPTRDGEAYVQYVRGTYLFLRAAHVGGSAEDLHLARGCFEQALARDPSFGWAYAGLSNYFAVCAARNLLRPFVEHFGHAIALSHRALEIDPTLAIPHVHFGVQAMYLEYDWARAGREFSRAVELDPSYAEARRFLGIFLGATGAHDAGLQELRESVQLEPQIPLFRNSLADALLSLGEPDEAITHLRAALSADPGYRAAAERLVRCLERKGAYSEAIAVRRKSAASLAAERFAAALERDGEAGYRRELEIEVRQRIDRLAGSLPAASENAGDLLNPPELRIALAYAELGEWQEAFAWEERAAAAHPGRRLWFIRRPELAPLAQFRD